jgi:hypothetical protein
MRQSRAAGWVAGTVFLVIVIFVATYFFVAAPKLESAALTLEQSEAIRSSNEVLALQTEKLKSDFAKLEDYRAEVAALQVQIPQEDELADYVRDLEQRASAAGVTLASIMPSPATTVEIPQPVVPVPVVNEVDPTTVEEPPADAPAGTDDPSAAPAPAPVNPQIEGFASIPITLTVVGPEASVMGFLSDIQTQSPRLLLVSGLSITRLAEAEATGGRPAIVAGDIEVGISGALYALKAPAVAAEAPTGAPAERPVLPTSDRNPFVRPAGSPAVTPASSTR